MTEDRRECDGFYYTQWKGEEACRFANKVKKQEIEFFVVQKMYLLGRACVSPFSDYKQINPNVDPPWNTPILLASQHVWFKKSLQEILRACLGIMQCDLCQPWGVPCV